MTSSPQGENAIIGFWPIYEARNYFNASLSRAPDSTSLDVAGEYIAQEAKNRGMEISFLEYGGGVQGLAFFAGNDKEQCPGMVTGGAQADIGRFEAFLHAHWERFRRELKLEGITGVLTPHNYVTVKLAPLPSSPDQIERSRAARRICKTLVESAGETGKVASIESIPIPGNDKMVVITAKPDKSLDATIALLSGIMEARATAVEAAPLAVESPGTPRIDTPRSQAIHPRGLFQRFTDAKQAR